MVREPYGLRRRGEPLTITIDSSVLLSYYQAKAGVTTESAASSVSAQQPIAPWKSTASATSAAQTAGASLTATSLAESIIGGAKLINPSAAQLSVSSSNGSANSDYQNLFALYQGLTSLQTLANAASTGVGATQTAQLQKAFSSGLNQVQSFLTANPFKEFEVGDGTVTARDQSTVGSPEENDTYVTGLTADTPATVLPSLQGDVQFSMTVKKYQGATSTMDFNLNDMGSTPRTLGNIVNYMNAQLKAAGVTTRFADTTVANPAYSSTTSSTSKTAVTTPATLSALEIKGSALETVSFSAAVSTAAVYVGETSTEPTVAGTSASSLTTATTASSTTATTLAALEAQQSASSSSATSATAAPVSQVLNFDPTGVNAATPGGKVWSQNLPAGASVQATATASDGSIYVLADVTATTNGQILQGTQDAALMKYDTAGNLVYIRTLGAAVSASGSSLAVSADGTEVAVAGSVSGTLDPTDPAALASGVSQSFVSVYKASTGDELWTYNQDAASNNQVNGVAFGADSTVYLAGTTSGHLPGATSAGGQDGYLQTITAKQSLDLSTGEKVWTAKSVNTQTLGTTGTDSATGVAVNGTSLYVSSVESGHAVVREYDTTSGAPSLVAKQDLGALDGGTVSGIAIGASGGVVVAGSTHNASLDAGNVDAAYAGDGDAFVAQLSPDLSSTSGEQISYVSNGGEPTTATGLTVSNGQIYITGQAGTGASAAAGAISELGYAAEIDSASGQVGWSKTFHGVQGDAAPTSIAVSAVGNSVLDAMGLPEGTVSYATSSTLLANTSLRAGDKFYVQDGSQAPTAVTVAADDTYSSLATKIERASNYQVSATTTTDGNGDQEIKITPSTRTTTTQVAIEAGPAGQDALSALGLKAGLVTNASTNKSTSSSSSSTSSATTTSNLKSAYTINVPTNLNLSSSTAIAAAQKQISTAIAELQSIYSDMKPSSSSAAGVSSSGNSALISYYNSQAANYATALARLTGAENSSAATTSSLASLI